MIETVLLCAVMLCVPGILPAIAISRPCVAIIFICPITGAVLSAMAVTFEFVLPGSFTLWLIITWILSNALAGGVVVARRRSRTAMPKPHRLSPITSVAIVASVTAVAAWFLLALKTPMMGFDTQAIWMLHAMFIYGGHHRLVSDLNNRAYGFSNRDYPPLVPSVSAMSFIAAGKVDPRSGVIMTALLNASALGVVAYGISLVPQTLRGSSMKGHRWPARSMAIVVGVAVLSAGFEVAGQYAVNGYADLLWAALATASVIFGLVLVPSREHATIAWICATAGALTKNEGLPVALVVIGLIAIRYIPRKRVLSRAHDSARRQSARRHSVFASSLTSDVVLWVRRCVVAAVMVIPGASWAAVAFLAGINNVFFSSSTPGPVSGRAGATLTQMSHYLHLLPIAVVIAAISSICLQQQRRNDKLANPTWLWVVLLIYLLTLLATYTLGSLAIHWWLYTSIERTMIFPQLLIYTDIAVWAVLATARLSAPSSSFARAPTVTSPESS